MDGSILPLPSALESEDSCPTDKLDDGNNEVINFKDGSKIMISLNRFSSDRQ